MRPLRRDQLKETLEDLYRRYDLRGWIGADPVFFPHQYDNPLDIEIAGFIASSFAFGQIGLFTPIVEKVLSFAHKRPYEFVLTFDPRRAQKLFEGVYYRIWSAEEIACFLLFTRELLIRYGSLGSLCESLYKKEQDIGKTLSGFVDLFMAADPRPIFGQTPLPRSFTQILPSPQQGSACKRLNLYLRWMVRSGDGVDFGLWRGIPPWALMMPVDTHVARIARRFRMTRRSQADWRMACEITERLRGCDPQDPVKYDFLLCHLGRTGVL